MSYQGISNRFLVVLVLVAGAGRIASGLEQIPEGITVTASKYDERTYSPEDEFKGCFTTGCEPSYVIDGYLNDIGQSRWSCEKEIADEITDCYLTFDLQEFYTTLSKMTIYFHKSNDTDRQSNPFVVSTSTDDVTYTDSFNGENNPGTPLMTGEDFPIPAGTSGRYVRLTGILDEDQWLSINEVEVYVEIATPAPSTAPTASGLLSYPSSMPTPSPSGSLIWEITPSASSMHSLAPTWAPTSLSSSLDDCVNVTVSNTDGLDGLYVSIAYDTFLSANTTLNAIIESSLQSIDCADAALTNCSVTKWTIVSEVETLPTYMTYDDVELPTQITEVWLRESCNDGDCVRSPANVVIVCEGGGVTSSAPSFTPSPTPAPVTSSDCEIVEVEGTSGGDLDGIYYDDGSPILGGVTQFIGYDDDLTRNGNTLAAEWVVGGCPSPSGITSGTSGDCTWRRWSIMPDSNNSVDAFEHFTYDEADHPVDIASGILWYTLETLETPYGGIVTISCASADTPILPTPSASPAPTTNTSSPSTTTPPLDDPALPPAQGTIADGEGGSEGGANLPAIVGGAAGAAVVLVIVGFVAYWRLNPPAPPSYDDVVGGA